MINYIICDIQVFQEYGSKKLAFWAKVAWLQE